MPSSISGNSCGNGFRFGWNFPVGGLSSSKLQVRYHTSQQVPENFCVKNLGYRPRVEEEKGTRQGACLQGLVLGLPPKDVSLALGPSWKAVGSKACKSTKPPRSDQSISKMFLSYEYPFQRLGSQKRAG